MIKRPLVWVLGSYLAGIYLAWHNKSLQLVLFLAILIYLILYLLIIRVKNPYINHKDSFLWFLPILFLLGFYAMGGQMARPPFDQVFEKKVECELSGKITMIVEKQWGKALYVKDITVYIQGKEPYYCENVIVNCSDRQNYLVGNQITVYGEILKFSEATNPGQFNEKMYYQIENIDYKVKAEEIRITDAGYSRFHALLYWTKQKLIQVFRSSLPERESGAIIAMLLGEKYLLDEELKQLYQENGISHVLAISGLHITLIGMFIFKFFKKLKIPLIPATVVSILLIYGYGVLTNFSVSTNRAVMMMVIMLLASIFGKTYDMISATSLSAFLILLQNPMQIFHAGFLFSFGAILGIAVLFPCLKMLFPSNNIIINSLFISISAQAVTVPIVLSFYYQLPVYGVLINLIILPCLAVLILTAMIAGVAGAIFMPFGVFFSGGVNYILKFYEGLCRVGSNLPGNLITVGKPDWLSVFLYICFLLLFVWVGKRYQSKKCIVLLILAILIPILSQTNTGLEISMLDVGQGEAIFMVTESGTTYFIDGGSTDVNKVGTYRILPFLLSKGVGSIDYAMVTHTDRDHISGLKELLEGERITIKHLILPNTDLRDEAYKELEALAMARGVKLLYVEAGDMLRDNDVRITCLHPSTNYQADSNNAYSMVLSLTYLEFDMLFTGDLEQDGEKLLIDLLQKPNLYSEYSSAGDQTTIKLATDYDVLKVAHHGSKNATMEDFLELIQPEYALISCGKDNRYGHPHNDILKRLDDIGSQVVITYESGAITIKTDGRRTRVEEFIKARN